jgi:CheB methylesterase
MSGHDIIVVGASAGGVEALQTLISGLPRDLPAALFVVMHTSPTRPPLHHLPLKVKPSMISSSRSFLAVKMRTAAAPSCSSHIERIKGLRLSI